MPWPFSVKTYQKLLVNSRLSLWRKCPICGSRLHRHSLYWRNTDCGKLSLLIPIQRLRCSNSRCRLCVSLLPAFLRPYQRVHNAVREQVYHQAGLGQISGVWRK